MEAREPTYLSAAQAQKILDGCDRTTALGRRHPHDAGQLGLRADEVATLTLDNIDWRSRRDCRGTSSSISVTSSPILCNAPPQHGQAAGPG
jgi:integrase